MKKILVIGGGSMGSAFTIPCLENKNDVTITEPYSKRFIKNLSSKKKFHPEVFDLYTFYHLCTNSEQFYVLTNHN